MQNFSRTPFLKNRASSGWKTLEMYAEVLYWFFCNYWHQNFEFFDKNLGKFEGIKKFRKTIFYTQIYFSSFVYIFFWHLIFFLTQTQQSHLSNDVAVVSRIVSPKSSADLILIGQLDILFHQITTFIKVYATFVFLAGDPLIDEFLANYIN